MMMRRASRADAALGLLSGGRRPSSDGGADALVRRAERILDLRRRRTEEFGKDMFGEPGWDLLLAIYVGEQQGDRPTIAELTSISGVAASVALRWLNFLVGEGLIERDVHPTNLDTIIFQLTNGSRETLERYLGETLT